MEKSFAELLDESFKGPSNLEPGQKVKAVVASIGKEWVFLDLGGKSEGYLAKKEVVDGEGNITVRNGDTIEAYFLSAQNNGMLFTTSLSDGQAILSHLDEAYSNKIPVEGIVSKEIKGGFEIKIGGSARGFCPYSQIDVRRAEKAEEYIDQRLTFIITEYSGKNIVLSRRKVLEEEKRQKKEALQESLKVGDTVKGKITSVMDFGAFVDIEGIEGLIPVSEISWGRVEDVHSVLQTGQEVEVVVLKLDWDKDRYSFSLKETLPDPWETFARKYTEGTIHSGKIARLTTFGAFVTLEPGIDGLLHISQLAGGRRINHPREVVQEGQEVEVKVSGLNIDEKRISLAFAAVESSQDDAEKQSTDDYKNYLSKAKEAPSASKAMGTFGDLLNDKLKNRK
jgi:small subunit ribosomal protein S1